MSDQSLTHKWNFLRRKMYPPRITIRVGSFATYVLRTKKLSGLIVVWVISRGKYQKTKCHDPNLRLRIRVSIPENASVPITQPTYHLLGLRFDFLGRGKSSCMACPPSNNAARYSVRVHKYYEYDNRGNGWEGTTKGGWGVHTILLDFFGCLTVEKGDGIGVVGTSWSINQKLSCILAWSSYQSIGWTYSGTWPKG